MSLNGRALITLTARAYHRIMSFQSLPSFQTSRRVRGMCCSPYSVAHLLVKKSLWSQCEYGSDFLCAFPSDLFMGALLILRAPIAVRSSTQRRQQISATGLSEFSLKRFAGRCIHCDPLERNAARHFLPLEQGEM